MTQTLPNSSHEMSIPPLILPRGLIFLTFAWLVASWGRAIGFRLPLHPSPASYEPAVRTMVLWLMIGLTIGWPLFRLSQQRSPWPIRQTMLDLVVMLSMVQVVVWPMRLLTTWPVERVTALDCAIIAWAVVVGAIVAAAAGSRSAGARTLSMLACVVLALGGPAVAWLAAQVGIDALHLIDFSPLMRVQGLAGGTGKPAGGVWRGIATVALAGAAAWLALWLTLRAAARRSGEVASDRVS